jgi:hypothetical protein
MRFRLGDGRVAAAATGVEPGDEQVAALGQPLRLRFRLRADDEDSTA